MTALRTLLRDGWVIGIACAAALAYTFLQAVDDLLTVLLAIVDGPPASAYEDVGPTEGFFDVPYSTAINGHLIYFEPLLRHALLLALTVVGSALALHATRIPEEDGAEG